MTTTNHDKPTMNWKRLRRGEYANDLGWTIFRDLGDKLYPWAVCDPTENVLNNFRTLKGAKRSAEHIIIELSVAQTALDDSPNGKTRTEPDKVVGEYLDSASGNQGVHELEEEAE